MKKFNQSIVKYFEPVSDLKDGINVGVKNTDVIPFELIELLKSKGYTMHTFDKMSEGGRAIDFDLINPITGRFMTGSSSGTAINVFKGINDLGIGTDGGGSVLAPALALNLYAMISPVIMEEQLRKHLKTSTDGIEFSPSIGFMALDLSTIETALKTVMDEPLPIGNYTLVYKKSKQVIHDDLNTYFNSLDLNGVIEDDFFYDGLNRNKMIEELSKVDFDSKILITCEGPIDYYEYGDSVMGHYDAITKEKQRLGHKYYLKVVNMLNLSAIVVPTHLLSRGYLIIFNSSLDSLHAALEVAAKIQFKRSLLESSYFRERRG